MRTDFSKLARHVEGMKPVIVYKLNKWVPKTHIIGIPETKWEGMEMVTDYDKYVVLLHPDHYAAFAEAAAGNFVLQEWKPDGRT